MRASIIIQSYELAAEIIRLIESSYRSNEI